MKDPALWQKMQATPLVPPARHQAFVAQLMAHEGWARYHAEAAMQEYHRLLYLDAIRARPMATPPALESLRQLHMEHAPDFWARLGIARPAARTRDGPPPDLAETHALYQLEFGQEPIRGFWPDFTHKPKTLPPLPIPLALISIGLLTLLVSFITDLFFLTTFGVLLVLAGLWREMRQRRGDRGK